jgi:hypothetical protein
MSTSPDKLEFFKLAILEPTAALLRELNPPDAKTLMNFYAAEANCWINLGALIGYLKKNEAFGFLSNTLWQTLLGLLDRGDERLPRELLVQTMNFEHAMNLDAATEETLQTTFQILLLLTNENILDRDSHYFLETIGWASDEQWDACRLGSHNKSEKSISAIGRGFANVLSYWDEMERSSRTLEPSSGQITDASIPRVIDLARAFMSYRFNLMHGKTINRYFVLAGQFVNVARDDSPAWLDSRRRVFERLISLICYVETRAKSFTKDRESQLWKMYSQSVESSFQQRRGDAIGNQL